MVDGGGIFGVTQSREWMGRLIALLDAAVGQLRDTEHPAPGPLLEAAAILRQQVHPREVREPVARRATLLAWQVPKLGDYIETHIAGPISVADLCGVVQLSRAYFSRSFKRTFGESPHSFIMRRRVELAAHWMITSNAPLSEISLKCGFTDQPHLCKQFRRASGQSPAVWRREHATHPGRCSAATAQERAPAPLPARGLRSLYRESPVSSAW